MSLAAYGGGLLAMQACFWALLGYDALANYRFAMFAHQAWKIEEWSAGLVAYVGLLDLAEYAVWTGLPVFSFAALSVIGGWRRRSRDGVTYALALSALTVLVGLAFGAGTVAETGRLWLFFSPVVVVLAARELVAAAGERLGGWLVTVVAIQTATVSALKMWQDFQ